MLAILGMAMAVNVIAGALAEMFTRWLVETTVRRIEAAW